MAEGPRAARPDAPRPARRTDRDGEAASRAGASAATRSATHRTPRPSQPSTSGHRTSNRRGEALDQPGAERPDARRRRRRRGPAAGMKLAVVVQRYGADINGGAELHARYIAERLSRHASVEVVTTCARDYVTWKNELPAGRRAGERHHGPPLPRRARAQAARLRAALGPGVREDALDRRRARLARQRRAGEPGAACNYVEQAAAGLDFVVLFSYRYYHAWHLARRIPEKAVIVPTAERDPAIGLSIFGPVLRGVRALMYNSPEERAMIQAAREQRGGPGRRRRRRLGRAGAHRSGAVPPQVQDRRARSRSTSAGSTRTRAAASSSRTSSATPRRSRAASTWS